jgi:hypothetical protein
MQLPILRRLAGGAGAKLGDGPVERPPPESLALPVGLFVVPLAFLDAQYASAFAFASGEMRLHYSTWLCMLRSRPTTSLCSMLGLDSSDFKS